MTRAREDRLFDRYRRTGDVRLLAAVFDRVAPVLWRIAVRLSPDVHAAEDAVQNSFLVAIEDADTWQSDRALLPWMLGILTNQARRAKRRAARPVERERLPASIPLDPSAVAEDSELRAALGAALDRVPMAYRETLKLHLLHGSRPNEIAAASGLRPGTVRMRLRRGLAHLRRNLPEGFVTAGMAGALTPSAHAAMRQYVLSKVTHHAAISGAAVQVSSLGALAMKKTTIGFVTLLAMVLVSGLAWYGIATDSGPTDGIREELTITPSRRLVSSSTSTAKTTEKRIPVRELVGTSETEDTAAPTGTLRIRAWIGTGSARQPAIRFPIKIQPHFGIDPTFDRPVFHTDESGVAVADGLRPGRVLVMAGRGIFSSKRTQVIQGKTVDVELEITGFLHLSGRVVDTHDNPIGDAAIEIVPISAHSAPIEVGRSGRDGRFTIEAVTQLCLIGARAKGYTSPHVFQHPGKDRFEITLVLIRGGGGVRGTVVDLAQNPIRGARVRIGTPRTEGYIPIKLASGGNAYRRSQVEVTTNHDGEFHAYGIAPGEQPLMVRSRYDAPWTGSCTIVADTTRTVQVTMQPGAACEGIVYQHDGTPAGSCSVGVATGPGFLRARAVTAKNGAYRLTGLPIGEVDLTARHRYRLRGDAASTVETVAGKTVTWSPRLSGGVTLQGRVETEGVQPRPIANAMIQIGEEVEGFTDELRVHVRKTDEKGCFTVQNISAGPVLSITLMSGVQRRVIRTGVDATAGEFIFKVPDPGLATASISGTVLNSDGRALPMSSVNLVIDRNPTHTRTPNAKTGAFELKSLLKGNYTLRAHAPGYITQVLEKDLAEGEAWHVGIISLQRGGWIVVDLATVPSTLRGKLALIVRDHELAAATRIDCTKPQVRSVPLPAGNYQLEIGGPGIASATVAVRVRGGTGTRVTVPVRQGVACRITTILPKGACTARDVHLTVTRDQGVVVVLDRILPPTSGLLRSHRCDLAPGSYTIKAQLPDGRSGERRIRVARQSSAGAIPISVEVK